MYESSIDIIYSEMQMKFEGDICKAVQKVGIEVNKEELIQALKYDREQYSKGFKDGYDEAKREVADKFPALQDMLFDRK